ncbi:uncharacterized protein [Oryza sativa Japonica Group]|uniref:uncharacterized protein n=1 Tax=Oryza sativa subsp. japonica TaxID=39947 RepID=UPI00339D0E18
MGIYIQVVYVYLQEKPPPAPSPWLHHLSPPPPSLSSVPATLQPPLPPCPSAGRPCRRLLQRRSRLLCAGLPSVARGGLRKCIPAGNSGVAATVPSSAGCCSSPVRRPTSPSPPSTSQPPPLPQSALRFAGKPLETRPHRQNSGVAATVPPVPPCRCSGCRHRHPPSTSPRRPPPWPALGFAGTPLPASVSPSASPEFLRQPLPLCPCAGRRRHLLLRHRSVKVALGLASPPSEPRRCSLSSSLFVLVDDSSGRSFVLAGSSSRCAATLVVIIAACSAPSSSPCSCCRLPSSPPRRFLSLSSRRSRSSWHSSLRQAVLVRRPCPSSVPLQPRRCLRPRLRVAKRCAGRVSPSSKDRRRSRPLAFRLRHSRPSPPRPFIVVVPSPRRVVVRISPSLPRPRPFGIARARCAVVDPGTRVPVSVVVRLCVW